ncbi:uncharacterized protein LOC144439353 [Glandiceps talaboti]
MAESNTPKKVMLWSYWRSRATALEFSMASVKSFKVFHDEFSIAALAGQEKHPLVPKPILALPGYRFSEVKQRLEADYSGKEAVFAMDHAALAIMDKLDYIPEGYQHVFLIRHPKEAIPSAYEAMVDIEERFGIVQLDVANLIMKFGSMSHFKRLFDHVTGKGYSPIVIDSEDLVTNTRETLLKLCDKTGLPFYDSMLEWEPGNINHWLYFARLLPVADTRLYTVAYESSSFVNISSPCDLGDLPGELKQLIEKDKPIYEDMLKLKI